MACSMSYVKSSIYPWPLPVLTAVRTPALREKPMARFPGSLPSRLRWSSTEKMVKTSWNVARTSIPRAWPAFPSEDTCMWEGACWREDGEPHPNWAKITKTDPYYSQNFLLLLWKTSHLYITTVCSKAKQIKKTGKRFFFFYPICTILI